MARPGSGTRPAVRFGDAFVGRAGDLAEVQGLLEAGHQLVTITGPPGVGKTRLARQLLASGAAAAPGEPAPIWCRLAEARNIDEMAAAVAQALHREAAAAPGDPAARIGAALAQHEGLIVLDNVEQLLEVTGPALGPWLEQAPAVRLLVTSRARLGVEGEVVHPLGPLSLPDEDGGGDSEAVTLFVQRARQVAPDFAASERDRPLLAQLVRALDGLPLAIELAAARAAILGLSDLLRGLERRFEVLRRARAAPSDPHAALHAAFDASWELLSHPERSVFAQCAVFRGGFTLEAAEAVLLVPAPSARGDAPGLLDVLDVLQRHSLIVSRAPVEEPHRRRFVLLESLRDYALQALTRAGDRAAVAARHARHYARRAIGETAAPEDSLGLEALRWLARERANVVAAAATFLGPDGGPDGARRALETVLALEPWADAYGYWDGYGALLEASLAREPASREPPGSADRASLTLEPASREPASREPHGSADRASLTLELRARLAWLRWRRSVAPSAEIAAGCHGVLARARALGDGRLVAGALLELGGSLQYGEPREARAAYEGAIAEFAALGDRRGEARARIALGTVCHRLGLAARAAAEAHRAARLLEALGDPRGRARALTLVSLALGELGEFDRLRAVAALALPILAAHQDRRWEAFCVLGLGLAAQAAGDWTAARARFDRAFRLARQIGDARLASCRDVCLGRLDHERGDLDAAVAAYRSGLPALAAVGDHTTAGLFEAYLGAALASRDDLDAATAAFARAEPLLVDRAVPALRRAAELLRGHLDLALARAALQAGDDGAAARHEAAAATRLRTFEPRRAPPVTGATEPDSPPDNDSSSESASSAESDDSASYSAEDVFVAARLLAVALDALDALDEPSDLAASPPGGLTSSRSPLPAPSPETLRSPPVARLGDSLRPARLLRLGPENRWFQVDAEPPCQLRRHRALHDLLLGLVTLRERTPGKAARVPELFQMGWPDERARMPSAANRVYVTLSRLRAMGLGGLLISRDDGWLIDPAVTIQRVEEDS